MRSSEFDSVRVRLSEDTFDRLNAIKNEFDIVNIQTVVYYLISNCDGHNLYKDVVYDKIDLTRRPFTYTYKNNVKSHQVRLDISIVSGISAMVNHLKIKGFDADMESVIQWVLDMNGR